MSRSSPDYVPDMNHDGKINSHDAALFHEMLDEDQMDENPQHTPAYSGRSEPWTIHHSLAKGLLLLLFGGYLVFLFIGISPINTFTALLALFSAVCFLRALLL